MNAEHRTIVRTMTTDVYANITAVKHAKRGSLHVHCSDTRDLLGGMGTEQIARVGDRIISGKSRRAGTHATQRNPMV